MADTPAAATPQEGAGAPTTAAAPGDLLKTPPPADATPLLAAATRPVTATRPRDGLFYGYAGEWGFYAHPPALGVALAAPAAAVTRARTAGGVRLWSRGKAPSPGAAGAGADGSDAAGADAAAAAGETVTQVNLHAPGTGPVTFTRPVVRPTDGLDEKVWTYPPPPLTPGGLATVPPLGKMGVVPAGPGGAVWTFPSGLSAPGGGGVLPPGGAPGGARMDGCMELFLRAHKDPAWALVLQWDDGGGGIAAPRRPVLRSMIREADAGAWTDPRGRVAALPPLPPPAAPAVPVDAWPPGGLPPMGVDAATLPTGRATITALVPPTEGVGSGEDNGGGDGSERRPLTWSVEGIGWVPTAGRPGGGATRAAALEDGLYLIVPEDVRAGGVVEFGSAAIRGEGGPQRLRVVLGEGGWMERVVHEVWPPQRGV